MRLQDAGRLSLEDVQTEAEEDRTIRERKPRTHSTGATMRPERLRTPRPFNTTAMSCSDTTLLLATGAGHLDMHLATQYSNLGHLALLFRNPEQNLRACKRTSALALPAFESGRKLEFGELHVKGNECLMS